MVEVRNFEKEVLAISEEKPVLVDFWAEWCQPCRILAPILEQLEEQANGQWILAKVNVDEHPHIAQKYHISGIPAVKLFWKREIIGEFVGVLPPDQIRLWLQRHLPNRQDDQLFAQALNDLKNHQIASAKEKLLSLLRSNPNHAEGAMMLFRIGILQQDWDLSKKALVFLKNCPEYQHLFDSFEKTFLFFSDQLDLPESPVKTKLEASRIAFFSQDYDNALNLAIQAVSMDKHYADDLPRHLVLTYFELLGRDSELVGKYKRTFEMALF